METEVQHPSGAHAGQASEQSSLHLEPGAHPHPGAAEYVRIAVILAVVTAIEVGIYYVPEVRASLLFVPVLLILSATKFSLVVLWFMHLRFDNRLFSVLFLVGLGLAAAILFALLALFVFSPALAHLTAAGGHA